MKLNSSLKKIVCFLLAVLMLMATAGCKDSTSKKKKKKVIIKKQVIVKNDDSENNQNNNDVVIPDTDNEEEETTTSIWGKRRLPEVAEATTKYVETFVPEFDYEYKDLNITSDYVIVYSLESWSNRKESKNKDGSDRYINYTGFARQSAYDLQEYFDDALNLQLEVKKDTEVDASAKKILVGDTKYYKSQLGETKFAVKVSGDSLIFEGGHFTMVNKAVKWFETVEYKKGKVAVLSGSQDDFKSQVQVNGVTYDYVWGDEFDGSELNNDDNWDQAEFGTERGDDFKCIYGDSEFQYIENGRLRLTANRYYDEGDANIGYASSGMVTSEKAFMFRNGYFEFRARLPYARGAFPAIWTMSRTNNKNLPNYGFDDGYGDISKYYWSLEFDLFESFADSDHATTTIHKWYTDSYGAVEYGPKTKLTDTQIANINKVAEDNGYAALDKATNTMIDSSILVDDETGDYVYYPIYLKRDDESKIDIFNYRLRPFTNMTSSNATYAYSFTYTGEYNASNPAPAGRKNGTYNWSYYFNADTINTEYHIYSFHYTSTHCTVYMDGEMYLDFDWDPAYDLRDVNGDGKIEDITLNNNGVGYNLWHWFMIDMMIYTPGNYTIDADRMVEPGDLPHSLYVDWVRCYQDLDDPSQAVWAPNTQAD